MRNFGHILLIVVICLCAFALSACNNKSVEWNQKLTITVEINGKEYSGSGVSRVKFTKTSEFVRQSRGKVFYESMRGEAIAIDLGIHGYLFLHWPDQQFGKFPFLLDKSQNGENALGKKMGNDRGVKFYKKLRKTKGTLVLDAGGFPDKSGDYPTLSAFKDIRDPRTFRVFHEIMYVKNKKKDWPVFNPKSFSEFYGGDARVKSIVFEITKEPVTKGKLASIITDEFLADWRLQAKAYGFGPDCVRKTKLRGFCLWYSKGAWFDKYHR